MPKYNIEVPLSGSIFFFNVEAPSQGEAIDLCRGKLAHEEQKRPLWSKTMISEQTPQPPKPQQERKPRGAKPVIDWAKWDKVIGEWPDNKIAKQAGCSATAVRKRRISLGRAAVISKPRVKWSQWDNQLGKTYDSKLAEKIGCDSSTVTDRRLSLGIPAYFIRKIDWSKWDKRLGTEPDSDLARKIGCDTSSVRNRRIKLERGN